jgi:intraflagellar transport protein 46
MNDGIETDKPYDEAIDLGGSDDDVSTPASSEAGSSPPSPKAKNDTSMTASASGEAGFSPQAGQKQQQGDDSESSSSSDAESSESDSEAGDKSGAAKGAAPGSTGAYNSEEYKGLKVSPEVEELFQYITRYKPHTIELDTILKPFVPELIPSIGEVDAIIKVPQPDGRPCTLGLSRLDEPTLNPSDPSILGLQLRSLSKHQNLEPMEVHSIENAEQNPKEIQNWISRIEDLSRSKPAPSVQYSRKMPDIEQLMQVWPVEFEEHLQQNHLPEIADLNIDLPEFIKLVSSLLDVPAYGQLTETLHVIFTLYSEFKSNQHFARGLLGQKEPDPYNFGPTSGLGNSTFNPNSESMAPSRAPSPS